MFVAISQIDAVAAVTEMEQGAVIVMAAGSSVSGHIFTSKTVIFTANEPGAVGVPETRPLASMVNPGGIEPLLPSYQRNVYGPVPPVAVI